MFLAFDDDSCGDQGVHEIARDTIVNTWKANILDEDAWEAFEGQWPDLVINGSQEDAQKWLNALETQGKVSDTIENLCWAIAETEEAALELLKQEIAQFE